MPIPSLWQAVGKQCNLGLGPGLRLDMPRNAFYALLSRRRKSGFTRPNGLLIRRSSTRARHRGMNLLSIVGVGDFQPMCSCVAVAPVALLLSGPAESRSIPTQSSSHGMGKSLQSPLRCASSRSPMKSSLGSDPNGPSAERNAQCCSCFLSISKLKAVRSSRVILGGTLST